MIIPWQHLVLYFLTKLVLTASMRLLPVTTQPIMLRLNADQIVNGVKTLLESQLLRQITENKANEPTKTFAHDTGKDDTEDKVIIRQEMEKILREDSLEVKTSKRPVVVKTKTKSPQRNKPVKQEMEKILREDSLEVKTTKRPVVVKTKAKSPQRNKPVKRVKKTPKKKKGVFLNEELALALLREPSPDGDNLGLDSLEQPTTEAPVPRKINGIYMRKHMKPIKRADKTKSSLESDSNEG